MSPAKQPYPAPQAVCTFFAKFRCAIEETLPPDLRALHRCKNAEERGGGSSGMKRYLHNSRFDDILSGFIYEFWPNDMGTDRISETVAMGLYIERKPFELGVQDFLRTLLLQPTTRDRIQSLGFNVGRDLPINKRDSATGVWLAKKTIEMDSWDDEDLAVDCGTTLARMMTIVHPLVRDLVNARFPQLRKH